MHTFHDFAWFFADSYDLGQIRRLRIESNTLAPWFSFFTSLASHGGSCELMTTAGRESRLVYPRQLMTMTHIPREMMLLCEGCCGSLGFRALIFCDDRGELSFDACNVDDTTWSSFLDLLDWIARETQHDVLVVDEYHDDVDPLELTWLRYSRHLRTLSVEGDPNRDFE
ncbi:MAG: hypothetical protein ACK5P8_00905 [Phycisphaerae bacterium]|jgi:hypothetical protein